MAKGVDFFTWDTPLLSVAQLEGELSSNTPRPSKSMGLIPHTRFAVSRLIAPICRLISFRSALLNLRFYALAANNPIQLVCFSDVARHF